MNSTALNFSSGWLYYFMVNNERACLKLTKIDRILYAPKMFQKQGLYLRLPILIFITIFNFTIIQLIPKSIENLFIIKH